MNQIKALIHSLLHARQCGSEEAWLASAPDLAELERRMRSFERETSTDALRRLDYLSFSRH
jgi:hypothetical protein